MESTEPGSEVRAEADDVVEAEIVCSEDACGHAVESHGGDGCMVLGCAVPPHGGPCEATYVEMVAPPSMPPDVIADPSTLAGRARVVADLIERVGDGDAWNLDVNSYKWYVNSRTGRAQAQARLCMRSHGGVRAVAEVLGGCVETAPWEHGEPGSLHHAVSAYWRGVQVEAYAIVTPSRADTGAGQ